MDNTGIKILVNEFRAINNAEIVLDGITVVSGENGSGKSTLSKLLYFLFQTTNNFDDLIKESLSNDLKGLMTTLDILYREIFLLIKKSEKENMNVKFRSRDFLYPPFSGDLHEQQIKLIKAVDSLKDTYLHYFQDISNDTILKERITRFENMLINEMKLTSENEANNSFPKLLDILKTEINKRFDIAFSYVETRPVKLFYDSLREVFPNTKLPKNLEVTEFGTQIISNKLNMLSHSYIIQNVAYIDTPMSMGEDFSENKHWFDLNEKLRYPNDSNANTHLSNIIQSEIIKGDISFEESSSPIEDEGYIFRREDGSIFNLLECATGIKSFAILQLLLKNGFLNDKTLLIIDEPEAHLHPQWIIEYARLIILLSKELGVKFFIASHNPDMVGAIKYISEKEGIVDKVNFYLSRRIEKSHSYNFIHLGTNIEEIFASFNIAIDRINLYGITSE